MFVGRGSVLAALLASGTAGSSVEPLQASYPAACVYEAATGRRLRAWPLSASSWGLALAPDGRSVAVAERDGTVDLFRVDLAR